MKVVTGKVVAGRIVIEGEPLEEGSTVTVLAPERDETFVLDSRAEAALLAAMAEADRGEVITGERLLRSLHCGTRVEALGQDYNAHCRRGGLSSADRQYGGGTCSTAV